MHFLFWVRGLVWFFVLVVIFISLCLFKSYVCDLRKICFFWLGFWCCLFGLFFVLIVFFSSVARVLLVKNWKQKT